MAFFVQYHLKEHVARTHTKEIPCTIVLTVASNCFSMLLLNSTTENTLKGHIVSVPTVVSHYFNLLLSNPTTEHTQQRNPTSALTVASHYLAVN